jgi:NAD(P)-dependent dehydrogenase (short-subunit alcohol dehydrogenase family)
MRGGHHDRSRCGYRHRRVSGIGFAIAEALLANGWKLILADLAQDPLEAARARLDAQRANATKCIIMDVANEASVIAGLERCEDGFGPVRVNAIAPGPVDTPLVQATHDDAIRADWIREVPQRRYASPDEIAGAAVFLLDDRKASFVTGHILNVDGGFAAAGYLPGPGAGFECR